MYTLNWQKQKNLKYNFIFTSLEKQMKWNKVYSPSPFYGIKT